MMQLKITENCTMVNGVRSRILGELERVQHNVMRYTYNLITSKILPLLGHSSQLGSVTPALHASQNQGSVDAELTVLDSLVTSETP